MGLFGDRDVEAIDENIFAPPVGTWNGIVGKVEVSQFDTKEGVTLTGVRIPIHQEGTAKKLDNSFVIDGLPSDKLDNNFARLKLFLLALEVPTSKMNSDVEVLNQMLEGVKVVLTTKRNGQFVNIVPTNTGLELKRVEKSALVSTGASTNGSSNSTPSTDMFANL